MFLLWKGLNNNGVLSYRIEYYDICIDLKVIFDFLVRIDNFWKVVNLKRLNMVVDGLVVLLFLIDFDNDFDGSEFLFVDE